MKNRVAYTLIALSLGISLFSGGYSFYVLGQRSVTSDNQTVYTHSGMEASNATGAVPLVMGNKIKFTPIAPQTHTWALSVTYVSSSPFVVNGIVAVKDRTVYQLGTVWDESTSREFDTIDFAVTPVRAYYSSGGGERLRLQIQIR